MRASLGCHFATSNMEHELNRMVGWLFYDPSWRTPPTPPPPPPKKKREEERKKDSFVKCIKLACRLVAIWLEQNSFV